MDDLEDTAPAPVAVDTGPVKKSLEAQARLFSDFIENIGVLGDTVAEIAELFEKAKSSDKVSDCRRIRADMIRMEAQVEAQQRALTDFTNEYRSSIDTSTDFEAQIAERLLEVNCVPEDDERFQEMEERLWRVNHPNEPMPGAATPANEDDDLVMEDAGRDVARNARCPISAVEIMDIKEPVVDLKGFVYEKAAVEHWLRGKPGHGSRPVPCPVAATSHSIVLAELKKAVKVIREQRRRQIRPQRQQQNVDEILDV